MAHSSSQSELLTYVAVLAALIGGIGFAVFGWRFGGDSSSIPFSLGLLFAAVAIIWTLYQRL